MRRLGRLFRSGSHHHPYRVAAGLFVRGRRSARLHHPLDRIAGRPHRRNEHLGPLRPCNVIVFWSAAVLFILSFEGPPLARPQKNDQGSVGVILRLGAVFRSRRTSTQTFLPTALRAPPVIAFTSSR